MAISDSTVAIIGAGNIGSRLTANFAPGGQDFVAELIRAGGYEPVRVGGLDQSIRIDGRRPARIRRPGPDRDQIRGAEGDLT